MEGNRRPFEVRASCGFLIFCSPKVGSQDDEECLRSLAMYCEERAENFEWDNLN
jgi:hypothetical protein